MSDFDEGHTVTTKINTVDDNNYPKESVIIPIMNSPIFPGMIAPIILSEDKFTPELDKQIGKTGYVALNLVKLSDELNNDEIGYEKSDIKDKGSNINDDNTK